MYKLPVLSLVKLLASHKLNVSHLTSLDLNRVNNNVLPRYAGAEAERDHRQGGSLFGVSHHAEIVQTGV